MAVQSWEQLLSSLTRSLENAVSAAPEPASLTPPAQELTLLTTKNELFLSYIQNLVFLIIIKLRHATSEPDDHESIDSLTTLNQQVTEKLAELRLYLEKGIKPLESRLKYQIDKVLRAAEEASAPRPQASAGAKSRQESQADISGSDPEDEPSDANDISSEDEADLAAAPNQAALMRTGTSAANQKTSGKAAASTNNGLYRPPRITPTALPTTQGREPKAPRKAGRSAALDEFIADELSTAPLAEPSIGSTIREGGRHLLSQRERDKEADRRRYEEDNYTRLPAATKKERAKTAPAQQGGMTSGFGGEEWQSLGRGLERIGRLTGGSRSGGGVAGSLARSRKRAVQDGPRASGETAGRIKRYKSG